MSTSVNPLFRIHIFLFTLLFLLKPGIKGQEIISSSGNNHTNSNGSISYTVGEPVVETYRSNNVIITQGFNQTCFTITKINEFTGLDYEIEIYPNPSEEFVILTTDIEDKSGLRYLIYNLNGILLMQDQVQDTETFVSFHNMPTGGYILKINKDNKEIRSFRIVKTQ